MSNLPFLQVQAKGHYTLYKREHILQLHSCGTSCKRLIRLNNQAQEILSGLDQHWNYNKDFVLQNAKKPENLGYLMSGSTTPGESLEII